MHKVVYIFALNRDYACVTVQEKFKLYSPLMSLFKLRFPLGCHSIDFDEKLRRYYGIYLSLVNTLLNNLHKMWIPKPCILIIKCIFSVSKVHLKRPMKI